MTLEEKASLAVGMGMRMAALPSRETGLGIRLWFVIRQFCVQQPEIKLNKLQQKNDRYAGREERRNYRRPGGCPALPAENIAGRFGIEEI
jgi:hypothetical protein